jgi:hypothetical protein
MSDDPIASGVWGIIGAVVGSGVGGYVTYRIESHFRKQDRQQVRRERISRVHRTTGKIINELLNMRRQALEHVPAEHKGPFWPLILPMIGIDPAPLSYSIDDISVIAGPKADDVAHELIECEGFRNVIAGSFVHYNELRGRLSDALMPFTIWVDGVAQTDVAYRANAAIVRLETEVESLATQIASALQEMDDKIYKLGPMYNAMMDDLNGEGNRTQIVLPPRAK